MQLKRQSVEAWKDEKHYSEGNNTSENQQIFELRNFYLQLYRSFFRKFSPEVEKCIMCGSIQILPNQVSKNLFYTLEDIDLRGSHTML